MRGVGAENFQATLEAAVDKLQAGGSDIIFMNMQYSPTSVPETVQVGQGESPTKGATAPANAPTEKRTGAPRLARVPGRQRGRHGAACVRHPGELKRNAGARAWLTPEESEKLELLSTAYQISTSTLTRDIILEGLEAHADLIEKTRKFLDSLGKGRASA